MSVTATATSLAAAATTSAASGGFSVKSLKPVGIILAVVSGLLIGSSFVFKKKGLIRSQAGGELGEGVGYLKSALWWTGMILMILGELCNFAAYAFVEAIVVTPLGALSVVVSAMLSSWFLNEKLTFFGWLGCILCILGSIIIALNGPQEESVGQIREFQKLFLAPGFLSWASILIVASLVIIFYFAPKYGKKSMLWYISVCSMIGSLSVSVTTGLGAAIVTTATGDNQFKFWFIYFLLAFIIITLLTEIYYLNIALALFNTAMVTPTYYVIFTFFTLVTTIILFQGMKANPAQIISLVMAFLVICVGITILQMSKVDPTQLNKLDRRSTLLLQAARQSTGNGTLDEKGALAIEDPGMDTLRGSFGTVGSIIRARTVRRMSQSSRASRPPGAPIWADEFHRGGTNHSVDLEHGHYGRSHYGGLGGLKRHQLYDAPVPHDDARSLRASSIHSQTVTATGMTPKRPTIKFGEQDLVHSYNRPGHGENKATHEHRQAVGSPSVMSTYPPLPAIPSESLLVLEDARPESSVLGGSFNVAGIGAGGGLAPPSAGTPAPRPATATGSTTLIGSSSSDSMSDLEDLSKLDQGLRDSQLLSMSTLLSKEHLVHSAPPTMYGPYKPVPTRKDSRDIFTERVPSTTRTTLLSFPSVTDSARSQDWDEEELAKILKAEEEKKRAEEEKKRAEEEKKRAEEEKKRAEEEKQKKEEEKKKEKEEEKKKEKKEKSKEKEKEKEKNKLMKRYPTGSGSVDVDESESLWHQESEEDLPPGSTGIRLVPRK